MEGTRNIQDSMLNAMRRDRIRSTIHMINGYQINNAIVRSFDNFVILVDAGEKQMLLYKHAISTITPEQRIETEKGSDPK